MSEFTGFGPKTKKFLRDLGRNNDKAWFTSHRGDYEAYYLEPAKAFVEAAGPKLEKVEPRVVWEPRVNGSIFRVNRDIRFSKDKTPYKDHIDFRTYLQPVRDFITSQEGESFCNGEIRFDSTSR